VNNDSCDRLKHGHFNIRLTVHFHIVVVPINKSRNIYEIHGHRFNFPRTKFNVAILFLKASFDEANFAAPSSQHKVLSANSEWFESSYFRTWSYEDNRGSNVVTLPPWVHLKPKTIEIDGQLELVKARLPWSLYFAAQVSSRSTNWCKFNVPFQRLVPKLQRKKLAAMIGPDRLNGKLYISNFGINKFNGVIRRSSRLQLWNLIACTAVNGGVGKYRFRNLAKQPCPSARAPSARE
jgi:hypothetical protein